MTGAMYAAISGLKSHMQKLNVIGNNVANVNTYGYKAARTTFKESLYTTVYSGSNGTTSIGGVNPSQIGYGCSVGTLDLDMSTANYTPTGVDLDCMIDGDGFFMVGSKPNTNVEDSGTTLDVTAAKDLYLTRVGNFKFDSQGYLVDGAGNVVYGFVTAADGTGGKPNTTAGVVAANNNNPSTSTQLVPIRLPLAAKASTAADAPKEGTAIYPGVNDTGMNVYDAGEDGKSTGKPISVDSVSIDGATGKVTAVNKETDEIVVVGYIALANVSNPAGVTHVQGPYYRAMEGAGDCVAASIGGAVKGYLNNQEATTDGAVMVGSTGTTALITGGLESSGTDLATEISEMITTQRGYQANTRIITVTDSMLEELVNMKR